MKPSKIVLRDLRLRPVPFRAAPFIVLAWVTASAGIAVLPACPAAAQDDAGVSVQVISAGSAPTTETWAEMVRREEQIVSDIRAGRRPPRRPQIADEEKTELLRPKQPGVDADRPFPAPGRPVPVSTTRAAAGAARIGGLVPLAPSRGEDPPTPGDTPKPSTLPFVAGTVQTLFDGANLAADEAASLGISTPPDTIGSIGPAYFVEAVNTSVRLFNRSGVLQPGSVSPSTFFQVTVGGVTYPRNGNGTSDPRVVFDRRSGRWFACIIELGESTTASIRFNNNNVLLAVSRTSDPTQGWDKYVIPAGVSGQLTDYPTLGVDDTGVYIGVQMFPTTGNAQSRLFATAKASLIAASPTLGPVTVFNNLTQYTAPAGGFSGPPQIAVNLDGSAGGRAWAVTSSLTVFGNVVFRAINWNTSVNPPTPSLGSVQEITTPGYGSQPTSGGSPAAPVSNGSGGTTFVQTNDDRLLMAVIRDGKLWTCRTIGVNSTGGGTSPNRNACEWLQFDVSGTTPVLLQSGRVYDSATTNFLHYYFPALSVNGQGHMVIGFSGSNATTFVNSYATGRLSSDATGTTPGAITTLRTGEAAYLLNFDSSPRRWGDYSYTSIDPADDMSFWTAQTFARSGGARNGNWGTVVAKILAPAPTITGLVSPVSAVQGQRGVTLRVNGTGFYDPGSGFTGRLRASFSGGGISNVRAFYSSATSIIVQCDVDTTATAGTRTLTVTNPDDQTATLANALTVTGSTPAAVGASVTGATRSSTINLTLAVRNAGGTQATGVRITSASLTVGANTTATTTPLPAPSADGVTLAAGATTNVVLSFPASAGTTGQTYTLRYQGASSAGSFTGVYTGTLP
jgi:hypothetical protein